MIEPKFATLLLNSNQKYPIHKIHYDTKMVTLMEKPWVYNTVSFSDVEFDISDMSQKDIVEFNKLL